MAANSKPLTSIYQRSIILKSYVTLNLFIQSSKPFVPFTFLLSIQSILLIFLLYSSSIQSILLIFPSLFFIHSIHPTHLSSLFFIHPIHPTQLSFFSLHPSNPSYSSFLLQSSSIQSILLIFPSLVFIHPIHPTIFPSSSIQSILLIFLLYFSSIQSILIFLSINPIHLIFTGSFIHPIHSTHSFSINPIHSILHSSI